MTRSNQICIPKSVWDLDSFNHLKTNYEPSIDSRHPGFTDLAYQKRRKEITEIAFNYKHGEPIPRVAYTEEEKKTWQHIYKKLNEMYPSYACKQHRDALELLEKDKIFSADFIPQLEDASNYLKKKTGFQLRPVAGLLSARDFLASLAFRIFQCTQYVRHSSSLSHSLEPDCVHELLGHVPLLSNPSFAEFSQQIGLVSLGASDEDIKKLSTLYWFTIEFGICKENGEMRAFGAALLSAYGELEHAFDSGKPELKPFEIEKTACQDYQDSEYQTIYFVSESFEEAQNQFRKYTQSIKRPFHLRYDPYTQSIIILDNFKAIKEMQKEIKAETELMLNSLERLTENDVIMENFGSE